MNNLQKIGGLLAKEGRTIVYGKPTSAPEGNTIALSIGDGDNAVRTLGDGYAAMYTTVNADVYCSDYSAGYDLLLAVRGEIQNLVNFQRRRMANNSRVCMYTGVRTVACFSPRFTRACPVK